MTAPSNKPMTKKQILSLVKNLFLRLESGSALSLVSIFKFDSSFILLNLQF